MKAKEKVKDFRAMGIDELRAALATNERELLNLRFRHAAGQLEQSAQLRSLRRQIAQVKTVIVEKGRVEQGN